MKFSFSFSLLSELLIIQDGILNIYTT